MSIGSIIIISKTLTTKRVKYTTVKDNQRKSIKNDNDQHSSHLTRNDWAQPRLHGSVTQRKD